MMPAPRALRQNVCMTAQQSPRKALDGTVNWLSRVPAWAGDVLAIVVALILAFFGGPLGPKGRGDKDPKPGDHELDPGMAAGGMPTELIVLLVLVLLAIALIPLRRRWPLAVFLASFASYCATVVLREPSMGVGFVVILAAFSLGSRTTRKLTLIVGAAATLITVIMSLVSSKWGVIDTRVFQIAAGLAVAAALGDSSRSHREFVAAANERAERAEQTREAEAQQRVAEERLRIAQDLHDTVAHQISVISLNAGAASSALETHPDKVRSALGTIRTSAREVLAEIGGLLNYLRTDTGAPSAPPQPTLDDLDALLARMRDAGLAVTTETTGDLSRLVGAPGRVMYRVVQEGLTNAHKHGSSGHAQVRLSVGADEACVTISNPVSIGAKNQPGAPHGGLGLTGVRERVASVGGTVETATDGGAFTITARIPLKRENRNEAQS